MTLFEEIISISEEKGCLAFALIDPDGKSQMQIRDIVEKINKSNFDAILVGGSIVNRTVIAPTIKTIKKSTELKVIIFPGSSSHISKYCDGLLFTSLVSSRNPQYLIQEQVDAARKVYENNIECIGVGYIHIDGESCSDIEKVTDSKPLSPYDFNNILSHCLASQYFGHKFIYLEAGSGATQPIQIDLLKRLIHYISCPIIIGGGITTSEIAQMYANSGVKIIVIGNLIETDITALALKQITNAIHHNGN